MCDPAKAAHKTFSVSVDKRSRKAMEAYLSGHFRYYTMNSWNRSTSYACNMKLYRLGLEEETLNTLYDMIQVSEFYDKLSILIQDFNMAHDYQWQAGWNGRSGGYLVLYQGEKTPSKYRSFCRKCGQKNFKSVAETGTQTKNQEDVSNGDIGYIQEICKQDGDWSVDVDFGDGRIVSYISTENLGQLDLAYAMTIHKSQGSEYDAVLISLQNAHGRMLKRPLVYTAVTRAKRWAGVVGDLSALEQAIYTTDTEQRNTLLAVRIAELVDRKGHPNV